MKTDATYSTYFVITILVILSSQSFFIDFSLPADGAIPPSHYSDGPINDQWALIGFEKLNEYKQGQHYQAMEYCYIALYCMETSQDYYKFKFEWCHSNHITIRHDNQDVYPNKYAFSGIVCRDNGYQYEPLWVTNEIEQTTTSLTAIISNEIYIPDWFGVKFMAGLMADYHIERTKFEKALGITAVAAIGIGSACLVAKGFICVIPYQVLATYMIFEWLNGGNSRALYHSIEGRLDILNNPESCIAIHKIFGSDQGWDLPDILETTTGRRNTDRISVWIQAVFPSKIHIDFYSLYKDIWGEYSGQSETKIHEIYGRFQVKRVGFPGSDDLPSSPFHTISLDGKTASFYWDLSEYYDDSGGLLNQNTRLFLQSGGFIPDDENYDYYNQIGAHKWNVPVINFEISFIIDYQLPEVHYNSYPANPLGTVYEDQKFVFSIDYYTLKHLSTQNKIMKDKELQYRVILGDESLPSIVAIPLIPIIIGYGMLKEGGILIDNPEGYKDIFILPPDPIAGLINHLPNDNIQFQNPESILDEPYDPIIKKIPNHCVLIPDPANTIYIMPDPGIIPESFNKDPTDFAMDKSIWNSINGGLQPYTNLLEKNSQLYEGIAKEEIEARKQFSIVVKPGQPDNNDILTLKLNEISNRYQLGIRRPDGIIIDLLTINPPMENELSSITIKDIASIIWIPGSSQLNNEKDVVAINLPNENNATIINVRAPTQLNDYISLITVPEPEKHLIIEIEDMKVENYNNYVSVSIVDSQISNHIRSFEETVDNFIAGTFCIGNFVYVNCQYTSVDTRVPSLEFPISTCTLDSTPSAHFLPGEDLGGLFSAADPQIPSYCIADTINFDNKIFEIKLNYQNMNSDQLAMVISKNTNIFDGVLIRGMSTIPSRVDDHLVNTWLVSSEYTNKDTHIVRSIFWNFIWSKHIIDSIAPNGEYWIIIQHPGEDGSFFTTGSKEADISYLKNFGPYSFINQAKSSSDDYFFLSQIIIEDVDLSISQATENNNDFLVEGFCNRLDGTSLIAKLDDGNGNIREGNDLIMFGNYKILINIMGLPGGLYTLTVSDGKGNTDTWYNVLINGGTLE